MFFNIKFLKVLIFLALSNIGHFTYAQSNLFMPVEFQKEYENKTRSLSGKPGDSYWQNYTRYTIDAEVIPDSWEINGSMKIMYFNNSPDTLFGIVLRTYGDLYIKGNRRLQKVFPENINDGVQLNNLIVSDRPIDLTDNKKVKYFNTGLYIRLPHVLLPHDSLKLSVSWNMLLPQKYDNRMGAYDKSSGFIAYWYPQVGVYDDVDGWDYTEYLGLTEFYRGYADYNITIRVPSDQMVWATGELLNAKEVYPNGIVENLNSLNESDKTIVIYEGGKQSVKKKNPVKSWRYSAHHVPDFAFGISNYFRWDAACLTINGQKVLSNLVYSPDEKNVVTNLLKNQNNVLQFFSDSSPGIPYPYSHFTTFMGVDYADGMEFPMLANNGLHKHNDNINNAITAHEIAHSYFPYYVGVNEVKYTWMEEGWARFMDIKYIENFHPEFRPHQISYRKGIFKDFSSDANTGNTVPLFTFSHMVANKGVHVNNSYYKSAIMYLVLEDLLGTDVFNKCWKTYIESWKGKHPTPYDFMYTFESVSNLPLDWFWEPWIFEYGYPDIALKEIDDNYLIIENAGQLPIPFDLKITLLNGKEQISHYTAKEWMQGAKQIKVNLIELKNITKIEIIGENWIDVNPLNNILNL